MKWLRWIVGAGLVVGLLAPTSDAQFRKRLTPPAMCKTIEGIDATDDNIELFMSPVGITITGISCFCAGTCSGTIAAFSLDDRGGNIMTIAGTNPTCPTSGVSTFAVVSGANASLLSGEGVMFSVDNTPTDTTDTYTLCIAYK